MREANSRKEIWLYLRRIEKKMQKAWR